MDNFRLNITYEGKEELQKSMEIAFRGYKAEAYAIIPKKGMAFFCYIPNNCNNIVKLPFKMDAKTAADFAFNWLKEVEYGREPDHDGSNGKGWRLYTEGYSLDGSICVVTPEWAEYHK